MIAVETAIPDNAHADVPVEKKFERSETISGHETSKAKCPKCGSNKVSQIPGNAFSW